MKANARLLYPSISVSERVNKLGIKGALLFTWLFAHCDNQGRYAGSTKKVKAEVVPMLDDITTEDIERLLPDMDTAKLIIRYQDADGNPLLQILDWWDFQHGLKVLHASRHPAPDGWQDRVTDTVPRDSTTGRFVSRLKDDILGMLKVEDYSLADICNGIGMPSEKVLEVLVRLRADGIVEATNEAGELVEFATGRNVLWRLCE